MTWVQTQWRRGPLTVTLVVVVWLVLSGFFINAVFFGGGGGSSYPANAQANFLNACEQSSSATVAKCGCALSWIEDNVSLADFQAGESAVTAGSSTPDWLYKAGQACAGA